MASTAAQQRMRRATFEHQLALDIELTAASHADEALDDAGQQAVFASVVGPLEARFAAEADPWAGSPYAWVKALPAARRAGAAQAIVCAWLAHCGILAAPRHGGADHDLVVNGTRVLVRLSTVWSGGEFNFQGISAGEYDMVALVGIEPHRARLWFVPAPVALAHAGPNEWVTVDAARTAPWLAQYGGAPLAAAATLTPQG